MPDNEKWKQIRQEQQSMYVGCFADGRLATLGEALADSNVTRFAALPRARQIEVTRSRVETVEAKREGRYRISVPGFGVIDRTRALSYLDQYQQGATGDAARLGEMLVRLEGQIISKLLTKIGADSG